MQTELPNWKSGLLNWNENPSDRRLRGAERTSIHRRRRAPVDEETYRPDRPDVAGAIWARLAATLDVEEYWRQMSAKFHRVQRLAFRHYRFDPRN